jgi:hypothetical protein
MQKLYYKSCDTVRFFYYRAEQLGKGLRELGLKPRDKVKLINN